MRNTNKLLLLILCGTLCLPRVAQAQKENEKNKDLKPSQKEGKRDTDLNPSQKEDKRDTDLKPSQKENEKNKDLKPSQEEGKKERVFEPFRLGIGLPLTGLALPIGSLSMLCLEPQYAITDKETIGFRFAYYLRRGLYGLTGDYYLTTSKVRRSVGFILGIYTRVHGNGVVPGIAPRVKLNMSRTVITGTAHLTEDPFVSVNLGFYLWGNRLDGDRSKVKRKRGRKPSQKESKRDRTFQPFKLGIGTGYAFDGRSSFNVPSEPVEAGIEVDLESPTIENSAINGFSLFYLEPQYAVTDQIDVGFRAEVFRVGGGSVLFSFSDLFSVEVPDVELATATLALYGLTGEYYLSNDKIRPSIGLILGIYDQSKAAITSPEDQAGDEQLIRERVTAFGISPRLKVSLGRAVLSYTYHFTPNDAADDFSALNLGYYLWSSRY